MDQLQIKTPMGWVLLEADGGNLTSLKFIEKKRAISESENPVLKEAARQLQEYFEGTRTRFDLPTFQEGTHFQKKVWRTLEKVPYGKVISYKNLAEKMGRPKSARAVGNALGRNSIPIIVPCHRIVAESQQIGGFTGGVHRKRRLLALEQVQL